MRPVPIDLTDAELATAATACRAMPYQEGKRAKELDNRQFAGPIEANPRRNAAPAENSRHRASGAEARVRVPPPG